MATWYKKDDVKKKAAQFNAMETPQQKDLELREWQEKIAIANRNNIFCHCRRCGVQWVDSSLEAACRQCDSTDVEHISCWQFPDD